MTPDRTDPDLTIVIPVYNYAQYVVRSIDQVLAHFADSAWSWELLIVDDGSNDGTFEVIERTYGRTERVRPIRLEVNQGKGAAVMAGLRAGRGKYRLFFDCDLTYPLEDTDRLIRALEQGADAAIANRRLPDSVCQVKSPLLKGVCLRHRAGLFFNRVVRAMFGLPYTDTQAGCKAFRAETVALLENMAIAGFAFDVEVLVRLSRTDRKIVEVPVTFRIVDEETTVQIWSAGRKMLADLIRLKWNMMTGKYGPG